MEKVTKENTKTKSKIDTKKETKPKATTEAVKETKNTADTKLKKDKSTVSEKKSTKTSKKDSKTKTVAKAKVSKASTNKKATAKTSSKKASSKEVKPTKKTNTKKAKTTKAVAKKALDNQPKLKVDILEYYDLPYRYNQTVVKLLFQTPTTLFVYWDITDKDRQNYVEKYGENFFNNTRPVLIVHNETKNYTYELDINDFANSWYLTVPDADCKYVIELGRRPNNNEVNIPDDYIYITSSNQLNAPNDKILFEPQDGIITYKNAKTYKLSTKDFGSITFMKNLSDMYSLYSKLYNNEFLDEFKYHSFKNPSSGIR